MTPQSRLPSATPQGKMFGAKSSSEPSISQTPNTSKKKEEEGEFPFLDFLTCNICGEPFFTGLEKGKVFWLSSCGHVMCDAEEHDHKEGLCTTCGKKMKCVSLQEGHIQPMQKAFLSNTERGLDESQAGMQALLDQLSEKVKGLSTVRNAVKFQNNQHKRAKMHYDDQIAKKDAEMESLRNQVDIFATENVELKQIVKTLQSELQTLPSANHYDSQGLNTIIYETPRRLPMPLLTDGRLPTVPEEDEGLSVYRNGISMGSSLGKRQRLAFDEQQLHPFIPNSQVAMATSPMGYNAQPVYNDDRIPQTPSARPYSVSAYAVRPQSAGPPKPILDRYRFNGNVQNGIAPQVYTQGYIQDKSFPMQRPVSVFDGPSGSRYIGDDDGPETGGASYPANETMNNNEGYRNSDQMTNQNSHNNRVENDEIKDARRHSDEPNDEGKKFRLSQAHKRPPPQPF
ncbi:uncharacterized protein IL334_006835 [Kwoniella shivajii]|uniref:RING-type domain-containing protein n=1 Tax=Kwoniella shivajii TaxID=564305 RepID=A0ABZ1D973_9TREE|nr:hypothetical protein IL334_006835 [Kwoniella shivajii]